MKSSVEAAAAAPTQLLPYRKQQQPCHRRGCGGNSSLHRLPLGAQQPIGPSSPPPSGGHPLVGPLPPPPPPRKVPGSDPGCPTVHPSPPSFSSLTSPVRPEHEKIVPARDHGEHGHSTDHKHKTTKVDRYPPIIYSHQSWCPAGPNTPLREPDHTRGESQYFRREVW